MSSNKKHARMRRQPRKTQQPAPATEKTEERGPQPQMIPPQPCDSCPVAALDNCYFQRQFDEMGLEFRTKTRKTGISSRVILFVERCPLHAVPGAPQRVEPPEAEESDDATDSPGDLGGDEPGPDAAGDDSEAPE